MEQIARTTAQIGGAIRRKRRSIGLSQKTLGARIGTRQATLSGLENGEQGTRLGTLVDILAALGLELVVRDRTRSDVSIEDVF